MLSGTLPAEHRADRVSGPCVESQAAEQYACHYAYYCRLKDPRRFQLVSILRKRHLHPTCVQAAAGFEEVLR